MTKFQGPRSAESIRRGKWTRTFRGIVARSKERLRLAKVMAVGHAPLCGCAVCAAQRERRDALATAARVRGPVLHW